MSWLSVNLNKSIKSIGEQVSHLTREVLAEDEDDGEGGREILVPQRQYSEVRAKAELQQQELSGVQAELEDTRERLRASDLHASQHTQALHSQLMVLQEELRALKEQRGTWEWDGEADEAAGGEVAGLRHQLRKQKLIHQEELAALLQRTGEAGVDDVSSGVCRCGHTCDNTSPTGSTACSARDDWQEEKKLLLQELPQLRQQLQDAQLDTDQATPAACLACPALQADNTALQESLQLLDQQQQAHTETLLEQKKKLSETILEQEHKLSRLEELEGANRELQATLQQLREEKHSAQAEVTTLHITHVQTLQVRDIALQDKGREVSELQSKQTELEDIKTLLEKRILTLDHDGHNQTKAFLEQKKKLEKRREDTATENLGLKRDNDALQAKLLLLDQLVQENTHLRREIQKLDNLARISDCGDEDSLESCETGLVMKTEHKTFEASSLSAQFGETETRATGVKADYQCEDLDPSSLELEREKTEIRTLLQREKVKYEKIERELWEREREVQDFREKQQKMMLDDGENINSSASPQPETSEQQQLQTVRAAQLEALVTQLRLQLRDTTQLLQASHIQQGELEREVDELRDQLESEECFGRTPPDGGCSGAGLSPSPSRQLHTIDEEETTTAPALLDTIDEETSTTTPVLDTIDEEISNTAALLDTIDEEVEGRLAGRASPVRTSPARLLHTIEEEGAAAKQKNGIEMLTESVERLALSNMESERSKLMEKIKKLTNESNALKALVEHLEEQSQEKDQLLQQIRFENQNIETDRKRLKLELESSIDSATNAESDVLSDKVSHMQSELDSVQTQLIYKKDQFDNLLDGVQKIGTLLHMPETGLHIEAFYTALKSKVDQLNDKTENKNNNVKYNKKATKIIDSLKKDQTRLEKTVSDISLEKEELHKELKETQTTAKALETKLNENVRKEKENLDAKLDEYQNTDRELEQAKNEISKLDAMLKNVNELVAQKTSDVMEVMNSKEEIANKCTSLMEERKSGQQEQLTEERDRLHEKHRQVLEQIDTFKQDKIQLADENSHLLRSVTNKNEELAQAKEEQSRLFEQNAQMLKLVQEKNSLAIERSELEEKLVALQREKTVLEEQLTSTLCGQAEVEQQRDELSRRLEEAAPVQELQDAVILEEKTALHERLSRAEERAQQTEALLHTLRDTDLPETKEKLAKLKGENETLTDQLATLETLQLENTQLTIKLEQLTLTNGELMSEVERCSSMEEEKQSLLARVAEQEKSEEQASALQQQLTEQLHTLGSEREQMIATITQKHQESVAYHAEIQRLGHQTQQVTEQRSQEKLSLMSQQQQLQQELDELNAEVVALREASAAACSDLQLTALQAQLTDLTAKLADTDKTRDDLRREKDKLNQDKDQLVLANSQFNSQYQQLTKELTAAQEAHERSSKEVSRLKQHLLTTEEHHTEEMLQGQATEQQLRQATAQLQEKIQAHSLLFTATSERTSGTVEQLQRELAGLQLQREELSIRLQQTDQDRQETKDALNTLHQVLQDFQQSQARQIAEAVEKSKRELQAQTDRNTALQHDTMRLKEEVSRLQQFQLQHTAVQQQLQVREQSVKTLQTTVSRQEELLRSSKSEVSLLRTGSDAKVDKTLVRNLFLGYLSSTAPQQVQVLPVLATVLGMTSDERTRVGLTKDGVIGGKGWMSSIADFLAPPASNVRVTSKVDVLDHASLSQAFVRFLEDESQPKGSARLPAVKMAEETEQRAKDKGNVLVNAATTASSNHLLPPLAFSFSPPLHPPMPLPPILDPQQLQQDREKQTTEQKQASEQQQQYYTPQMTSSKLLSNLLSSDSTEGNA